MKTRRRPATARGGTEPELDQALIREIQDLQARNPQHVRELLEAGASPDVMLPGPERTPVLAKAITEPYFGRMDASILGILLAAGANPNIRCAYGYTALSLASEKRPSEPVKALLAAGADVRLLGRDRRSPLYNATAQGNCSNMLLLLDHGADPWQKCGTVSKVVTAFDVARGEAKAILTAYAARSAVSAAVAATAHANSP